MKVKGCKKLFYANRWEKEAKVAIIIADKIDFKTKAIKTDTEGHFIIIKGRIHQEDINIVNNICTQHRSTQIYKTNLGGFKKDIDYNTLILVDFNTPLSKT